MLWFGVCVTSENQEHIGLIMSMSEADAEELMQVVQEGQEAHAERGDLVHLENNSPRGKETEEAEEGKKEEDDTLARFNGVEDSDVEASQTIADNSSSSSSSSSSNRSGEDAEAGDSKAHSSRERC